MRVMFDTNILVSAIVFRSRLINDIIAIVAKKHTLVLCSYVIDELHEVIDEKFSCKKVEIEKFLYELPYEYIYTPDYLPPSLFPIRDEDDKNVLFSAILADVDILVTGDKDFDDVDIERPEILSPRTYVNKYG